MMMAQILIGACWIVFIAYWIITAWSTKKTAEPASVAALLGYRVLCIIGVLVMLVPARWSGLDALVVPHSLVTDLNIRVVPHSLITEGIAVCVCILGLLGAIWARRTLAGNWSMEVVFKENHELVAQVKMARSSNPTVPRASQTYRAAKSVPPAVRLQLPFGTCSLL